MLVGEQTTKETTTSAKIGLLFVIGNRRVGAGPAERRQRPQSGLPVDVDDLDWEDDLDWNDDDDDDAGRDKQDETIKLN